MKVWEEFLLSVEKEFGKAAVHKWLRPLVVTKFDAGNIFLEAQNTFQIIWFEEHIRKKIPKGIDLARERPLKVHLALGTPLPLSSSVVRKNKNPGTESSRTSFSSPILLDASCTFETLLESQGNLLARKISDQLIAGSREFNPVYFTGPPGCGKTHLLMALTKVFDQKGLKALYTHAEAFSEHLVSALRFTDMSSFRGSYRSCDVLLVDDVHLFSKKSATQEEFFHTFNTLHNEGKQIILSSGDSPQELAHIEPRLVSRFEWGVVVPIQAIHKRDFEQILRLKSQSLRIQVPSKIINYLLTLFTSSPKSLVEAFNTLLIRLKPPYQQNLEALTAPSVRKLLLDLIQEEEKNLLSPSRIISSVADHFGIGSEEIVGKGQGRDIVIPRQLAIYLCRETLKLSYIKIGDLFNRDHSTVMSSIKQLNKEMISPGSRMASHAQAILKKLHIH